MIFRRLQLSDIPEVRPFFDKLESRSCDFTVGGMFMWRDFFNMEFSLENDVFISRLFGSDGGAYYNLPISNDIQKSVADLVRKEITEKGTIKFCTIPESYVQLFTALDYTVSISEQYDFSDYIYAADDLISLKGKKYSGIRNQISQFDRNVDSWEFREIQGKDIAQVCKFFCEHYLPAASRGIYEQEENFKVLEVLENMDAYGLIGGVLFADNAVAGFSINEVNQDTLYTHIEKADRRFKGVYQMLMNQTAATFALNGITYINREEDMGDLGLRTSKKSYHPIDLLKKYVIEVK